MSIRAITQHNRHQWDAISAERRPRAAAFFVDGGSTLDESERAALGDLTGKRVLHLMCATGNESFSLTGLGAEVVGVDISAVAIGLARDEAERLAGAPSFVVADVYDLPDDLGVFDVVHLSAGAVCWLPDLAEWARIVVERLRPGGRLVVHEHHPLWEVLAVDGEARVRVTGDYFERGTPADRDNPATAPLGWRSESDFVSFVWPIGDIVTALLGVGLTITGLREDPVPAMYDGLGPAAGTLPATYTLTARRGD
ncbi:class I SAM-dependent methyltransferase [Stackebrandtia soli]|uniref:class I SAM-dependent methyltransferase n=1 Tax=Stackebrandtia soli TaxID=1892856 RepID=UPI0039ECAB26